MKASPHRPTKALIHLGAIRQNILQMGLISPEKNAQVGSGQGQCLWSWSCCRCDGDSG